jgi:putative membrane protein
VAEVALGRLALEKSSNDQVRQLGERLVQDHEQIYDALKSVSRELALTLPSNDEAEQLRSFARLRGLSGAAFDREYMQRVVVNLKKAIVLYDQQAASGDSAELRAFAAKALPSLQRQLLLAESIERAVVADANVAAQGSAPTSPLAAGASGETI